MSIHSWPSAVRELEDRVLRLTTPWGAGTGFVLGQVPNSGLVPVATAAHVVDNAHYWQDPIRLQRKPPADSVLLKPEDRVILLEESLDTAVVLARKEAFTAAEADLDLAPVGKHLAIGCEVGWLGYPALASNTLCFFHGHVSAMLQDSGRYLIDGVAINGVSGGPAFTRDGDKLCLIGVVSAYMPNRATGEALPGVCVISDIRQFQHLAEKFAHFKDAKERETMPPAPPPPPPGYPLDASGRDR